jgi:signal transduction histidine kinase
MTAGDAFFSAADGAEESGPRLLPSWTAPTIGDLVATAVAAARRDAPAVRFDCDIDPQLARCGDPQPLAGLLAAVMQQAVAAAVVPDPHSDLPPLCEVVVTAVDAGNAVEIEVADSGAARAVVAADLETMAARLGGSIVVAACPEGGTAITLRLPRRRARGMAA